MPQTPVDGAYNRVIKHYDTDAGTLLSVINKDTPAQTCYVNSCSFELLRLGGCGSGSLTLTYPFDDCPIDTGHYIEVLYAEGDKWYFGRVEEVVSTTASGVTVRMHGLWSELGEIFIGGFNENETRVPHKYARSDLFKNDPDYSIQSLDSVDSPKDVVQLLYDQYIAPQSVVTLGDLEESEPGREVEFRHMVFRGEESVAQILRTLGMMQNNASFGVDADKRLYFVNRKTDSLATFQEGVDVTSLSRSQDRSLMYNRLLVTGGLVYGSFGVQHYRYRANVVHYDSAGDYGERRLELFVPWVRTNLDMGYFARSFFAEYAGPTNRYSFTTLGMGALLKPWEGRITLLDKDGGTITTGYFNKIDVEFNEAPTFSITLGPEDVQFPEAPEPQQHELANPDDQGDGEDNGSFVIPPYSSSYALSSAASEGYEVTYEFRPPPPQPCARWLNGIPTNAYPGYEDVKQVLAHDERGCLLWISLGQCDEDSSRDYVPL